MHTAEIRQLPRDPHLHLSFCWQISLRQGMKAETGALMSLCEKTDNDIRSCINTLQVGCSPMMKHLSVEYILITSPRIFLCVQFLFSRGLKQLDIKTIQCVSVGQKDQNKGLFHLWQEIFQLPRTKRYSL